ncbi:MAG: hypothetical protein WCO75_04135 [Planctomycetota bacterium]
MAKRTTNSGDTAGAPKEASPTRVSKAPADSIKTAAPLDPTILRAQRMCERRAFRDKDVSISRMVGDIARQAKRDVERSGSAAEAWRAAMPAQLIDETWIESVSAMQIVIGVSNSPASFAVDRALRAGVLAELRRVLQVPGLRVKIRLGQSPTAVSPRG